MEPIYLDYNATTPIAKEVADAMRPFLDAYFGNPSSVHTYGVKTKMAVEKARRQVLELINCEPSEIIFTSGGTESNNYAIKGIAMANRQKGNHIITSAVEHPAVFEVCRYLGQQGFEVSTIPVDEYGIVEMDELKAAIRPETILITVMHANNEVGTIQPVAEIARIARARGTRVHSDGAQAVGKIAVDVRKLGVDLYSVAGHKFYGPKGVGALYVRKGVRIDPLLHGGRQEWGRRAATENVAGIVGLGKAIELRMGEMEAEAERLTALRERLYAGLAARIDHVYLNGHPTERLPGTLNVCFEYIEGEGIIMGLDLAGVAVSSGSACTSASLEPSHVLLAMGVHPAVAQGSIRFSLGRENTEEDVDYVLETLPPIVERLRAMSMFSPQSPFPEEAGPRRRR